LITREVLGCSSVVDMGWLKALSKCPESPMLWMLIAPKGETGLRSGSLKRIHGAKAGVIKTFGLQNSFQKILS
jgi:hypothetical protein